MILLFIMGEYISPWVEWFGGAWAHLQGAISALFILTNKVDMRQSLWCCWCWCYPRGNRRDVSHFVGSHEANCSKSAHHNCSPRNHENDTPVTRSASQQQFDNRQGLPLSFAPSSAAVAMAQQQTQVVWDAMQSSCIDTHLDDDSPTDIIGLGGCNVILGGNQIPSSIEHHAQEHSIPVRDPILSAQEGEQRSRIRAQIDFLLSQGKFADAAQLLRSTFDRNGIENSIISELTSVHTLESGVEQMNAPPDGVTPATTTNVELVNLSMFSESSIDEDALESHIQSVLGILLA